MQSTLLYPYYIAMHDLSGSNIFSTLSHTWNDFWKICTEHRMGVLIFSVKLSGIFILLRIIQRDINTNVPMFSCKVPVILVTF